MPCASPALACAPVIDGHRRLLDVVREFAGDAGGADGRIDLDAARALVAFLRQELLPFASREEGRLLAGSSERETTMFEHGFLAAEIDTLSGVVDSARRGTAEAHARTMRAIHRIEAVLELHVERHEDRWRDSRGGTAPPAAAGSWQGRKHSRRGSARPLDATGIDAILRRCWWGVLSTVHAGTPYAVPVAYGMSRGTFHIASRAGRKIDNLRANPRACLTVAEVVDGAAWSSVVITGDVEWVDDTVGAVRALRALARQCGMPAAARPADAARMMGATLFRIVPREMTGRTRSQDDEDR